MHALSEITQQNHVELCVPQIIINARLHRVFCRLSKCVKQRHLTEDIVHWVIQLLKVSSRFWPKYPFVIRSHPVDCTADCISRGLPTLWSHTVIVYSGCLQSNVHCTLYTVQCTLPDLGLPLKICIFYTLTHERTGFFQVRANMSSHFKIAKKSGSFSALFSQKKKRADRSPGSS